MALRGSTDPRLKTSEKPTLIPAEPLVPAKGHNKVPTKSRVHANTHTHTCLTYYFRPLPPHAPLPPASPLGHFAAPYHSII